MRLMMKVAIPAVTENPVVGDPNFNEKLHGLFTQLGAQKIYSRMADGRRFDYATFEIQDPSRIFAIAKPVAVWLGVKPEFMPDTITRSAA
jgi:hypothetical protein